MLRGVLVGVGCVVCTGLLCAQPGVSPARPAAVAQVKDIQIPKLTRPPNLEEFLGGAGRTDMKRVDDFRQRTPGAGVPVSQKTTAYIGYDDRNLYAVFVCQSPPGQLRARMAKREDVFSDDVVGILMDTYHDRQRGYEFFVNPLGVQADATESETTNDDFSFDTLWYSDGRVTPEGFVASITIPFRSLRFSPAVYLEQNLRFQPAAWNYDRSGRDIARPQPSVHPLHGVCRFPLPG